MENREGGIPLGKLVRDLNFHLLRFQSSLGCRRLPNAFVWSCTSVDLTIIKRCVSW